MTPDEINKAVELLVFGDDLKADPEDAALSGLRECVPYTPGHDKLTFAWNDVEHVLMRPVSHPNPSAFHKTIWRNRKGEPYCADLESHVAAYRRPARDFYHSWELMGVLLKKMRENSFEYEMKFAFGKHGAMFTKIVGASASSFQPAADDSLPAAVALAAVKAMENRKG